MHITSYIWRDSRISSYIGKTESGKIESGLSKLCSGNST